MFVVWLLQHPQNKIVLKKIVILPHTKKRAWVAVDELVPLLKALTTAIPPKTSEPETHAKYAYTNIVPAHYAW